MSCKTEGMLRALSLRCSFLSVGRAKWAAKWIRVTVCSFLNNPAACAWVADAASLTWTWSGEWLCPHFYFQGDLNALVSSLKDPRAFLRIRFSLWKATKVNGTAAQPNRTMHSPGALVGYVHRKPKSSLLQSKACHFCCQGFYYIMC